LIVDPAVTNNITDSERERWLTVSSDGFVTKTPANKVYYRVILELLWPKGCGIPGPKVSETAVRAAIDQQRQAEGKPLYKDPFRRMRELQGEEGFTCIIKEGVYYQLQSLKLSQKREPRWMPSATEWGQMLKDFGHKCNHCGAEGVKFSPDHRVPRSRNGANADIKNIQPLCEQCNNLKSSICSGCEQNCFTCPWAFPESNLEIHINDTNRQTLLRLAKKSGENPSVLANKILTQHFNAK
jgi:hypothetical protein